MGAQKSKRLRSLAGRGIDYSRRVRPCREGRARASHSDLLSSTIHLLSNNNRSVNPNPISMLLVLNSQMGHVGEMGQLILFDRGKLILYI